MDIIKKIDEAIQKPSFEEFFLNKKNKRMLSKVFDKYYYQYAAERGQDFLEDESFYGGDNEIDMNPEDAYEDFAHADGYGAAYDAAENTIDDFKRKYDYKRNDESDEEKQVALGEFLGYKFSW